MKLPSLFPVAFFAGGILLSIKLNPASLASPRICIATALILLLSGCAALLLNWIRLAALFAAGAWLALGMAAFHLEQSSVSPNLAGSMVESGKLDTESALRWRGRLRGDPLELPWGLRYEINLDEVEIAAGPTPVSGGLRLTYYRPESATVDPPSTRAGDRVEVLARARSVRNFGDPGSFDYRGYLARQNIQLQGTLRDAQLLTIIGHSPLTLSDRFARLRGRFLRSINELFSQQPEKAALARAMLLGDRSFVERDRVVDFQKTGVYHVLVLAGLHVGTLAAFLFWAGQRLGLGLPWRILLTILVLAFYACIAEDRPPILRAVLMVVAFLCAQLLYRRMELLNVAAIAALLILAVRPSEITDASFLLSFGAVAMIGAIATPCVARTSEPYRRGLNHLADVTRDVAHSPRVIQFRLEMRAAAAWLSARMPRFAARFGSGLLVYPLRAALYFGEIIFIAAILQLGMLPPLAYYFHRVALSGPFANVPAVLLTGLAVPVGFLMLVASLVSHVVAGWIAKLLGILLTMLDASVRWFAGWHGASYRIPGPSLALMAIFIALALLLSAAIRMRWNAWGLSSIAIALLASAAVVAAHPFPAELTPHVTELTVLDVGQGDSLFLSFPHGRTMLVDAGGELGNFHLNGMRSGIDVGEDVVSPYLWSRGIKQLDVVALTHAHEDHLGGVPAILDNFRVHELWVGRDVQSEAYRHVLAVARAHAVAVRHLKQGDTFSEDDVSGSVLWPDDLSEGQVAKNDDSLVLRLTDGTQSMLLAGDIERASERKILAESMPVRVDFLKVAHHGSRTSTINPFLSAAHPAFAAISVGWNNAFGHPSPEVVERLEAAGVHVYRTDLDGAITAITDGTKFSISTVLHPQP